MDGPLRPLLANSSTRIMLLLSHVCKDRLELRHLFDRRRARRKNHACSWLAARLYVDGWNGWCKVVESSSLFLGTRWCQGNLKGLSVPWKYGRVSEEQADGRSAGRPIARVEKRAPYCIAHIRRLMGKVRETAIERNSERGVFSGKLPRSKLASPS